MSVSVEYLERQLKEFREATGCATAAAWLAGTLPKDTGGLAVGDVVRLRSGGPLMTVCSVGTAPSPTGLNSSGRYAPDAPNVAWVDCVWFSPTNDGFAVGNRCFQVAVLELIK